MPVYSPAYQWFALLASYGVLFFLGGLFVSVLWSIVTGRINVENLIREAGQNVSRFQMLVFTSVFGAVTLVVSLSTYPPRFPDVPQGFIYLMGASYGVYFLDKGVNIVTRRRKGNDPPKPDPPDS